MIITWQKQYFTDCKQTNRATSDQKKVRGLQEHRNNICTPSKAAESNKVVNQKQVTKDSIVLLPFYKIIVSTAAVPSHRVPLQRAVHCPSSITIDCLLCSVHFVETPPPDPQHHRNRSQYQHRRHLHRGSLQRKCPLRFHRHRTVKGHHLLIRRGLWIHGD